MRKVKHSYYKLTKNSEAEQSYHWVLIAPNGEIVLTSESYSSKQMAFKGIDSVRVNSPYDKNYDRKSAKDCSPYFNLIAQNSEIIGTSEMYSNEEAREVGIEAVKRYGRDAKIIDETSKAKCSNGAKPIVTPQKPWISC